MPKRLALVHTVSTLPAVFKTLCAELLPGLDLFHIVDESLLQNTIRAGSLSKATARRLLGHLASAQEAGASAVLVTCSSVGNAVDWSRSFIDIPVYRVDEPMAEAAVRTGARIGVAATLQTTMTPTADLIRTKAGGLGKSVQISTKLCEGAFDANIAGDMARHDRIVTEGLQQLLAQSDVIVLAQASMARVADLLPPQKDRPPILSSPRLAVEHLAGVL